MIVMICLVGGLRLRLRLRMNMMILLVMLLFQPRLNLACSQPSLDTQGMALLKFRERVVLDPMNALSNWNSQHDPCSWFGVYCSQGRVLSLILKDLSLAGTLAPELAQLSSIHSIILRNNSFHGLIPTEIADLPQLQVLDLGYNNFSGPPPSNLGNKSSLSILLLDNNSNNLRDTLSPELNHLQILSQHQVDQNHLRGTSNPKPVSGYTSQPKDFIRRILLGGQPSTNSSKSTVKEIPEKGTTLFHHRHSDTNASKSPSPSPSPSPSHSRSHRSPTRRMLPPVPAPVLPSSPPVNLPAVPVTPTSVQAGQVPVLSSVSSKTSHNTNSNHRKVIIWAPLAGTFAFLIVAAAVFFVYRGVKVVTVKPWASGLSGQLQSALVSGVPKLKRPELELACEDFSNIIGSLNDGTVYKGTLSSGVEIAVVASSIKSSGEWTKTLELQFRKKIETLSKVNHKNFVNLIGFCEEEKPFTRMMVFEYAPNGTLFEHLHIKEAERLDWKMRLRIVMGMAYCLEHMHQLEPPTAHRDMQSSSIYLSEDYAAKISDFSFWNAGTISKMRSPSMQLLEASSSDTESNVFKFGVVLVEMITGRIPYLENDCSVAEWVFVLLEKDSMPRESMDPTLSWFQEEEVQKLFHVIRDCVTPDAGERPSMREIVARLREITGIGPDLATPRLSPLWWAELEILSSDAN